MPPVDREIVYAIVAAVAGMAIVGNLMLAPQASAPRPEQHTYATEDIRYKLQQSDAKKKHKTRTQTPAPEKLAPAGSTRSGGGDGNPSDEVQEEPSLSEEAEAEEPPLD